MTRAAQAAEEHRNGTNEGDLLAYVAMMAELQRGSRDFQLLDLLLARGQFFEYAPRPSSVAKEADKACFGNALMLARLSEGLHYCEGFATSIIPVMHAWCVTDDGVVVDPTWRENVTDHAPIYFGLVMDNMKVAARTLRQGCYGIMANFEGNEEDFIELLRGEGHDG